MAGTSWICSTIALVLPYPYGLENGIARYRMRLGSKEITDQNQIASFASIGVIGYEHDTILYLIPRGLMRNWKRENEKRTEMKCTIIRIRTYKIIFVHNLN